MTPRESALLLETLQRVRGDLEAGTLDTESAICWQVYTRIPDVDLSAMTPVYVGELARGWPEFSGNVRFPVPAPSDGFQTRDSRTAACLAFNHLPKWEGEYGASRVRLLDYLITTLETQP